MGSRYVQRLLQPLAILPSQLRPRAAAERFPEMRLVVALLEDAIHCVMQHRGVLRRRERREFLEARAWLLDDSRDWPFAFANVCDLLGLDAAAVRRCLPIGDLHSRGGAEEGSDVSPRATLEPIQSAVAKRA